MTPLKFPVPGAANTTATETPAEKASANKSSSAERFEAVMDRAMTRSHPATQQANKATNHKAQSATNHKAETEASRGKVTTRKSAKDCETRSDATTGASTTRTGGSEDATEDTTEAKKSEIIEATETQSGLAQATLLAAALAASATPSKPTPLPIANGEGAVDADSATDSSAVPMIGAETASAGAQTGVLSTVDNLNGVTVAAAADSSKTTIPTTASIKAGGPKSEVTIPQEVLSASTGTNSPSAELTPEQVAALATGTPEAEAGIALEGDLAQEAVSTGVEATENTQKMAAGTGENPTGIAAAKPVASMNKGAKTKQVSEANEQKLPTGTTVTAEPETPAGPARSLNLSDKPSHSDPINLGDLASVSRPDTNTTSTILPSLPMSSVARAVDRMEDMITSQVSRLHTSGETSMQVVITPGAGLQLSLEVRKQGDSIEVQASLQHGDFQFLSRHWSDLQQQLEARGIRLSPLTSEQLANNSGNTNDFQQRQSARPTDELAPVMRSRGLTLEGVVAVASVPRSTVGTNRFDSWA